LDILSTIRVRRDIPYTEAAIGFAGGAGPMRTVMLTFDAYLPDAGEHASVPALVLAFGGAFHRGSKEDDTFPNAGAYGPNTAIAEYCRRFAAEGIACFSVQYRLAPDDPDPGTTPLLTHPEGVPMGRIDQVRQIMGLPSITPVEMAGAMEAAMDDMAAAARAIRARAGEFGIDPERLALGGWSAGARCALYAAYAERVPCAGVIALSGVMQPEDVRAYLTADRHHPPLLLIAAENDLGYVVTGVEQTAQGMRAAGGDVRVVRVPVRDHWYAADAPTDTGETVYASIRSALSRWVAA